MKPEVNPKKTRNMMMTEVLTLLLLLNKGACLNVPPIVKTFSETFYIFQVLN